MAASPLHGQAPTLSPDDYGQFERLGAFSLDPTGGWLVHAITRMDGSRELRLADTNRPEDVLVLEHASRPAFGRNGRFLAFHQGVSQDEAEASEGPIQDRLGLVNLSTRSDTVLFDIASFSFRDDGEWLAAHGASSVDSVGSDLIVMDPASGTHTVIGNVAAYAWEPEGEALAATLRTAWGSGNGVVLFHPETGTLRTLTSADADFESLTWHDESGALAVLRAAEADAREGATHDILVWGELDRAPSVLEVRERSELGDELRVVSTADLRFSADGRSVFFGVRPWEADDEDDNDGSGDEGDDQEAEADDGEEGDSIDPADVQVWHWDDDQILRSQEYWASRNDRRGHLTAWHMDSDRVVVLGDDLDEPVTLVANGRWGLVADATPYRFERRFGAGTADWYRVDPRTGARAPIVTNQDFALVSHAKLDQVLVYDEGWSAVSLDDLRRTQLADGRSFTRALEDYDYPGPRISWGVGGWAEDGSAVLLNDKHDVWLASLEDGRAERITRGAEADQRFRAVNLDPDQPPFSTALYSPDEELWFSVRGLRSKASGYASGAWGERPQERFMEDARVSGLTAARDGDALAIRTERWDDAPDIFVGDRRLSGLEQLSRTNPFQDDFAWGRAELIAYTTDAGHDLQAILIYPADFREGEEYPLILYQYERLSDNLHLYNPPTERQYYNYQAWSQNGYFVLMPDIVYEPGRPGPSALDAVEHALDAAIETGHVDSERMGIIGHSWGGYQASYLPTRTDRFAASVAGAAITNFMSFMGAVHWNGGLPETGHWETGQARMAAPYWEDLEGHLESSPAHFITDLETPMLLMHGDDDGVVDFYQGLEFYNYARRAGKEVVLLVYPGADHGLSDESQQVDYHRRILEWFGHYLKGEPAAPWITDGESWSERAKRLGG